MFLLAGPGVVLAVSVALAVAPAATRAAPGDLDRSFDGALLRYIG
jgi:hypothetical protein